MFMEMKMASQSFVGVVRKNLTADFFIKHFGVGLIIAIVVMNTTKVGNQFTAILVGAMLAIAYPIARASVENAGEIILDYLSKYAPTNRNTALKFATQITVEILQIVISAFLLVFLWPLLGAGILAITSKEHKLAEH